VMSLPFIRAAKDTHKIFICCQPSVADVFRTCLPEEQMILWRPPWLDDKKKYGFSKWKKAGIKSVVRRLRQIRAQTAVSVWADTRIHLLMAFSGAENRIGFPMSKQNVYASQRPWRRRQIFIGKTLNFCAGALLGRRLLTKKIVRHDYFQHHVETWRQLAETLNLVWRADFPWLVPAPTPLPEPVSAWLHAARAKKKPIWLLHPGARTPNRRWPLEKFRELVRQIFLRTGTPLIVIDPPESPLPTQWLPDVFIYRPANLKEFFGIVNEIDIAICNDTGVSHIAAALGKRVICIFSANLPQWFAPYGNLDLVAEHDVCAYRPCLDSCIMPSYICVESVAVETVRRQIEKFNPANDANAG
jgi:ADP-heptose:LPS heptosyltransferase